MQEMPFLMEEFATIVETPFQISPRLIEVATNFGCRLYANESNEDNGVELVRLGVFSQKSRDVERIPPTSVSTSQKDNKQTSGQR